jgi:hypothetical protein
MNVNSRRLSILTKREIDDLYGLPRFSYEDRCLYFDLSADEQSAVDEVHTRSTAVHLALQLGFSRLNDSSAKRRAKLSRVLGKRALKSFHPRLFNNRLFAGESWSDKNGCNCRNQTASFC